MTSLRSEFASLGVNSSKISVLAVAQQFMPGEKIISLNALLEAASEEGEGEGFEVLPIASEGSGDYRANRFRIYFRHPNLSLLPVADLVSEFGTLFPQIFNGFGSQVDSSGLEQNIATTFYRHDKPFKSEPTLQFTADIRVVFDFLNAPDLHDDWVGFVHQDPDRGFAVQTLKRNFTQGNDVKFGLAVAEAIGLATSGNPFLILVGGISVPLLNRYHFLAGRRSWIIAPANQVRGPNFEAEHPIGATQLGLLQENIYVLETAAVERFSSWLFDVADAVPGVVLSNMDGLITEVWTTLLSNYVKFKGFEPLEVNSLAYPVFDNKRRGVSFVQSSFVSRADCLAQDWVQDLLTLHPGIAAEF